MASSPFCAGAGDRGTRVADRDLLDPLGLLHRREVRHLGDAPTADQGETNRIGHVARIRALTGDPRVGYFTNRLIN
jgi:hypothetical protein